jgi:Flp pilus assembly protein TadG
MEGTTLSDSDLKKLDDITKSEYEPDPTEDPYCCTPTRRIVVDSIRRVMGLAPLGREPEKVKPNPVVALARKLRDESGVVIAEAALILPVFIFVGLGLMDMQWEMKHAANIDYVANEVARCEALAATTPSAPLPCQPSTGGVSPHQYAVNLAQALRINGTSLAISTPACNPGTGVCQVTIQFQFKPVGVWFPMATISRTGTASYLPAA